MPDPTPDPATLADHIAQVRAAVISERAAAKERKIVVEALYRLLSSGAYTAESLDADRRRVCAAASAAVAARDATVARIAAGNMARDEGKAQPCAANGGLPVPLKAAKLLDRIAECRDCLHAAHVEGMLDPLLEDLATYLKGTP